MDDIHPSDLFGVVEDDVHLSNCVCLSATRRLHNQRIDPLHNKFTSRNNHMNPNLQEYCDLEILLGEQFQKSLAMTKLNIGSWRNSQDLKLLQITIQNLPMLQCKLIKCNIRVIKIIVPTGYTTPG
uniref:Uncharacterized protein n=1 Tax=Romanomermis culicivorax TaxID=13658 RepID=A0A915JA66_ROMCU